MNGRIRVAVAIGFGAAVTLSVASFGWRRLVTTLTHPAEAFRTQTEIRFEEGRLLYFSDGEVLILPIQGHGTVHGIRYVVRIPDEKRWIREMPHWSRHSRSDVIADLKRLVAEQPVDLVETVSTTGLEIR